MSHKKKLKHLYVEIPIYNYPLYICSYDKNNNITSTLPKKMAETIERHTENNTSASFFLEFPQGGVLMLRNDKFKDINTIAHEGLHVVFAIMHYHGLDYIEGDSHANGNEHITYLLGYVVEQIDKFTKQKTPK